MLQEDFPLIRFACIHRRGSLKESHVYSHSNLKIFNSQMMKLWTVISRDYPHYIIFVKPIFIVNRKNQLFAAIWDAQPDYLAPHW